jgi:hypothetical protein
MHPTQLDHDAPQLLLLGSSGWEESCAVDSRLAPSRRPDRPGCQAFNLLGSYYSGAFEVSDAKPDPFVPTDTPNLQLAWANYQEAVRLKNPNALVNVGMILTAAFALYS